MITIKRDKIDGTHEHYIGRITGLDGEAELLFTWRGDHLVSADHTFTPTAWRGRGVAMAMVERLIADARAEGFRIIPLCPYIRDKYVDHPEWADVMTVAPGETPRIVIS